MPQKKLIWVLGHPENIKDMSTLAAPPQDQAFHGLDLGLLMVTTTSLSSFLPQPFTRGPGLIVFSPQGFYTKVRTNLSLADSGERVG